MKLTTRKIKQMIQEELENVLETRSFGGRPDGFMYPGEEEEKMRQWDRMKSSQVSPEDKMNSKYNSPEEQLMKMQQLCNEGDEEACRQEQMMMQHMYGQGDRMFERKTKRKKNG